MTITQTVEIPSDRRITVPREVPVGRTIIAFTPAPEAKALHECPVCAKNIDPVTGNPRYNAKVLAAVAEAEAMIKGDIPAKWHKPDELKEVWKELLED